MISTWRNAARLTVVAALACATFGCNNSGGGTSGGSTAASGDSDAVATVNGQAISKDEFYTLMQGYTPQMTMSQPQAAGPAIMQRLIQDQLLLQLAKQEGVSPTDADIASQFNAVKQTQLIRSTKSFDDVLSENGLTEQQFKDYDLTPAAARQNLYGKGLTIADADIQSYYNSHPLEFAHPQAFHIKQVAFATQPEAQQNYNDVKSGLKKFEDLKSTAGQAMPDNDFPNWLQLDASLPKPLSDALKNTPQGQVSQPINVSGSWWLVEVIQSRPASTDPESAVADSIRSELITQKAQMDSAKMNDIQQKLHDLQVSANITIVAPQYAQLLAQIKNPPPVAPIPMVPPTPPSAMHGGGNAPHIVISPSKPG